MILESLEKDQLYTALAQAQVEFPTIRVNRKAFKNEYADLYAILKPIYPILHKYELAIRPWAGVMDGVQYIGARLMHKSGQYETNVFLFEPDACKNPNDQASHKKQGALTYFNRNHIKDMLGVLISDDPEDNDMQDHHIPVHHEPVKQDNYGYINKDQLEQITKLLDGHKDLCEQVLAGFKIYALEQIPKDKFLATIDRVTKLKFDKEKYNIK